MSNYTITTDFGAKDSLPSSNDSKVVRGSEFTTEFTNIQTAIATKADTAGDTFTGVVNFSADVAVNTNTLFVDVSEAKVGIGTTSPDQKLQVDGNIRLGDTATGVDDDEDYGLRTGGSLTLHANDSGNNTFNTALAFDVGNASGAQAASSKIQFKVNNTERMRIDSTGNVGIGTTSPSSKFVVSDSGGAGLEAIPQTSNDRTTLLSYDRNTSTYQTLDLDASDFHLNISGTEKMRIDSSGNVGIGTTSPAYALDVTGSAQLSGGDLILRSDSDNADTQYIRFENYPTDIRTAYIRADYTSQTAGGGTSLAFGANDLIRQRRYRYATATDTDSMVIDIEGNVGIGTSSPSDKLHVSTGTDTDSGNIALTIGGTSTSNARTASITKNTSTPYELTIQAGNHATSNMETVFKSSDSKETMRIDSAGNVGIGTTSPASPLHVNNTVTASDSLSEGITLSNPASFTNNRLPAITWDYGASGTPTFAAIDTSRATGTGGNLLFHTASTAGSLTERMRIDSSGHVIIPEGITLGTATGTYVAANTLDDYEEGTWTPVIYGSTGGTGSGTIVNAKYTKVGGLVQVMCYLDSYDVTGLSGALRISGLPFNSNGYHISVIGYCNMLSTDEASVSISGYTESGSDKIYLTKGSSTTLIPASEATNSSGQLMLNFTYTTTS